MDVDSGLWMWIVGRDVNGVLAYKIKYRAKMELSVCAVVRVRNQTKPNRTELNRTEAERRENEINRFQRPHTDM